MSAGAKGGALAVADRPMSSFFACLLLVLICLPIGCSALMPAIARVAQGAQLVASALDVAEGGAEAYFARHPSHDREQSVAMAIARARTALAALDSALAMAEAVDDGDVARARSEALRAYSELRALLDSIGVLSGDASGGAESDAPLPAPVNLPTSADIAKALLVD